MGTVARAVAGLALITATMLVSTSTASASESAAGPAQPNIASAAVYALGHPTASPPGSNDFTCKPTAAHPRPVVLVHGLGATMGENWATLAPLLANEGYCVFALTYGTAPGEQVVGGLAPMEQSSAELRSIGARPPTTCSPGAVP